MVLNRRLGSVYSLGPNPYPVSFAFPLLANVL